MESLSVAGRCPMGCGSTLFLGAGGHVTCSFVDCPDPAAVDELLKAADGVVLTAWSRRQIEKIAVRLQANVTAALEQVIDEYIPRCPTVIPGVGRCELDPNGHTTHRRGDVTWNG